MSLLNTHSTPLDRFVREKECKEITGLSRQQRWKMEREGKFPKRLLVSERAVAWRLSDLQNWMTSLTKEQIEGRNG